MLLCCCCAVATITYAIAFSQKKSLSRGLNFWQYECLNVDTRNFRRNTGDNHFYLAFLSVISMEKMLKK